MTAVTEERPTLDLSQTPKVPLARIVQVEVRKMADTRAGKWLLISIGLITAAIVVVFFLTADQSERTFLNFVGITAMPQGFLLPVLGILLVTSEWTQRTALVTFTLTPVRGKVLAAKIIAAVLLGIAAILVALGIAAVATLAGGAADPWQALSWDSIGKFSLLQTVGVLQGLAFGLLLMNSAAAIVAYFILPTVFTIVSSLWSRMSEIQPWVDLAFSSEPLFSGVNMTNDQWQHLASGIAIWVVAPIVLGCVRLLRSEVK